jgi:myosin heavy subunit
MPRKEELHLSPRSLALSIDTSVSMITTASAGSSVESDTQESKIDEITNILTKRAAEISSIVQKNMSLDWFGQKNQEQHQQHGSGTAEGVEGMKEDDDQFATFINQALEESERLKKEVRELNSKEFASLNNDQDSVENYEMKKIVRELKMTQLALKDQELKTAMQIADMAKMEDIEKSHRDAVKSAKETIKAKDKIIDYIKQENEDMAEKTQTLNKTLKALTEEIARYEQFVLNSKSLAENQSSLIQENETTIRDLEAKNADLWSKWKNDANTLKCKDALLNMQRQRMEEQENLLKIYETKFLTKGVDIVKGEYDLFWHIKTVVLSFIVSDSVSTRINMYCFSYDSS